MTDPTTSSSYRPGLGAMLREARERAGLEISDLANATSIRATYLEALENEQLGDLPEPVYARNFLRLYARAVGVNPEEALAAFTALQAPAPPSAAPPLAPSSRPTRRDVVRPAPSRPPPSRPAPSRPAPAPVSRTPSSTPLDTSSRGPSRAEPGQGPIGLDELRRAVANLAPLMMTLVVAGILVGTAVWGFNRLLDRPAISATATTFDPDGATNGEPAIVAVPMDANADEVSGAPAIATLPGADAAAANAQPAGDLLATELPNDVLLTVISDPPGAEVSVDAFALPGITPIEAAPVSARAERTIRVELEGYVPYQATLDMTRDRNLQVILEPAPGTPAASVPAEERGAVVVTIREASWLEAYQGNARGEGERLAYLTAQPGERFVFERPVYLHLGNAAGVDITIDGDAADPIGLTGGVMGRAFPATEP